MIQGFLEKGILTPICSAYSTPINPVSKPDGSVRFVQDLRAINNWIIPLAPIVPDVISLLSSISAQATYFSVIDLNNAFFSIPVHEDTRPLFAFHLRGSTTHLVLQGYADSPVVYSIVLQATLKPWHPPPPRFRPVTIRGWSPRL